MKVFGKVKNTGHGYKNPNGIQTYRFAVYALTQCITLWGNLTHLIGKEQIFNIIHEPDYMVYFNTLYEGVLYTTLENAGKIGFFKSNMY